MAACAAVSLVMALPSAATDEQ
jgi:hypothetical protein